MGTTAPSTTSCLRRRDEGPADKGMESSPRLLLVLQQLVLVLVLVLLLVPLAFNLLGMIAKAAAAADDDDE
eukprot:evm.model.NODE_37437_length_30217_cov_24.682034.5